MFTLYVGNQMKDCMGLVDKIFTDDDYLLRRDLFLFIQSEMCNRPRLVIDLVIDYDFFQSNRNRNRSFLQNSNHTRNRNPVK
jgi:hypothetical protein